MPVLVEKARDTRRPEGREVENGAGIAACCQETPSGNQEGFRHCVTSLLCYLATSKIAIWRKVLTVLLGVRMVASEKR